MENFEFYLEFDGKQTITAYEKAASTVQAGTVKTAVKTFAKRQGLRVNGWESLITGDGGYRAYYIGKRRRELIYYVVANG
jgi:hypothetical protein